MDIEGVVLAAGYSSRAEAFKMALEIDGKSLIERCVEGMIDLCSRIIVVGGHQVDRVERILKPYPKVEMVFNERFAEGMFTSVKAGVSRVRGERFFFTPGDYPLISPRVCQQLLDTDGEIVIPTYGGRKGHPILIKGHLAQAILLEDDTSNLREFIRRYESRIIEVDEEGILFDMDTPEDYKLIIDRWQGGRV